MSWLTSSRDRWSRAAVIASVVSVVVITGLLLPAAASPRTIPATPLRTAEAVGGTILFDSGRDGKARSPLHSINSDGTDLRQIPSMLTVNSWTRDGHELAFVDRSGDSRDISVLGADGSSRRLDSGGHVGSFAWSPGGRKIAYDDVRSGGEVTVIDVKSGNKVDIGKGFSPKWSPDGKRIAFHTEEESRPFVYDLWVADADGTHRHLMATDVDGVTWSPDGKRLAYTQRNVLWIVNRDGSHASVLVYWILNVDEISWSPSGKRIAYEGRDGMKDNGVYAISAFVVSVNGHGRHRLFRDTSGGIPVWSPRGGEIAVGLNSSRFQGLYLVHPDGLGRRRVPLERNVGKPIWSSDGRTIAVGAGFPTDVWVIDVRSRRAERVTQGWRYGYNNEPDRWLPSGLPAALIPGQPVGPSITSDSIVEGNTLKATRPINQLAADGSTVAIHYARGNFDFDQPHDPRCLDSWNPTSGSLTRFAMDTCDKTHYCCGLGAGGFVDLTLAGDRLAWSIFEHFAGLDIFDLFTSTLPLPRPVLVPGVCPDNSYGDCLFPEVDLQGDGSLLVFDTWNPSCDHPSFPMPCSTASKKGGRLWRLDGDRATLIASSPGALTPLAVDGGRILVDHQDGSLGLLSVSGASLATFHYDPADFLDAKLQGNDLVVLKRASLADYDVNSGALLHEWPLGCSGATLPDLQDRLAVYICGSYVHTLWLANGRDVALAPAGDDPHAQLEAAGLFYSYQVNDATYPGRVTFIPFDLLQR